MGTRGRPGAGQLRPSSSLGTTQPRPLEANSQPGILSTRGSERSLIHSLTCPHWGSRLGRGGSLAPVGRGQRRGQRLFRWRGPLGQAPRAGRECQGSTDPGSPLGNSSESPSGPRRVDQALKEGGERKKGSRQGAPAFQIFPDSHPDHSLAPNCSLIGRGRGWSGGTGWGGRAGEGRGGRKL